ncbi:hypothetical protein DC3_40340 [Deinococcus cellulosilyticus NBRC 106333 = KACC 11606]|uniref:Uncharacterized protein n=1 Tax=Deinococcus cellulosilyticus (strain DSM 18568 / NBRC 106333 / KACC 11606 / 5516J-15) TaxID=1223518 RepID=A0A511N697_DEIC1|nr:hypothetical protein DC3_40340 [Deinococcus cellulosilyticus NBRC 106333 = KACC 11606]
MFWEDRAPDGITGHLLLLFIEGVGFQQCGQQNQGLLVCLGFSDGIGGIHFRQKVSGMVHVDPLC